MQSLNPRDNFGNKNFVYINNTFGFRPILIFWITIVISTIFATITNFKNIGNSILNNGFSLKCRRIGKYKNT